MKANIGPRAHTDKFPSSAAFDAISDALQNDAERKDAIKQGNGVYAFTLKNKAGETESWHIDLKETGKVQAGPGEKPNGTFPVSPHPSELMTSRAGASLLLPSRFFRLVFLQDDQE